LTIVSWCDNMYLNRDGEKAKVRLVLKYSLSDGVVVFFPRRGRVRK
jgi:hypothetical protein